MERNKRKICPVCNNLLWYNYCKLRWECPEAKCGCGYPDKNINLNKDKTTISKRDFIKAIKQKRYSCPACRCKNKPQIVIKDLIKVGCKRCGKSYSIIQKTLE